MADKLQGSCVDLSERSTRLTPVVGLWLFVGCFHWCC